jgi:hypothetical protein
MQVAQQHHAIFSSSILNLDARCYHLGTVIYFEPHLQCHR